MTQNNNDDDDDYDYVDQTYIVSAIQRFLFSTSAYFVNGNA